MAWPPRSEIEPALIELALARDLPLVATNDVHFIDAEEYEAHDVLLCIADGAQVAQDQRRRLTPEHRCKSAGRDGRAVRRSARGDRQHAGDRAGAAASWCRPARRSCRPSRPRPAAARSRSCARQAEAGLEARLTAGVYEPACRPTRRRRRRPYRERLDYELDVIDRHEVRRLLPDRRRLHPVGQGAGHPGRAGARLGRRLGGRLVARDHRPRPVALRPAVRALPQPRAGVDAGLRHRLLPGPARRGDPLRARQVRRRPGRQRSSPSASCRRAPCCATSAGRSACPMARSTGSRSWCRSTRPIRRPSSRRCVLEPRLAEAAREDEQVGRLIEIAQKLEGLPRHASTHAAGVVIGDRPLDELVPLYRDPRSDMPVTQFNMKDVEKAGLVKFDFLGPDHADAAGAGRAPGQRARHAARAGASCRSTIRRPSSCSAAARPPACSSWNRAACAMRCASSSPTASTTSSR